MPLFAFGVLTYVTGLAVGFSAPSAGQRVAAVVVLTVLALAAAARGHSRATLGACLAMAGLLVAESARRSERACAAALATEQAWRLHLLTAAREASVVRAETAAGCEARVTLFVARGEAEAGSVVIARGAPLATPRGLAVDDARLVPVAGPGPLLRARANASRAVDRVFRRDAPLAQALLLADTGGLSPELRERWGASGLVHMLSVSGLHVGLLAGAVLLGLRAARLRPTTAEIAGLSVVVAYVLVIGAPAPAVRAAAMLAAAAASRVLQRPTSPWSILAIGALHPVLEPRIAVDLGWQLSVVGIVGLAASGALVERLAGERVVGWRREAAAALLTAVLATVVTLPFTAPVFGRVSVVAPLTNLLAAPLMALAQPALFLGLLLAPVPALARLVADGAHPLLAALDGIAAAGGSVAWATVAVPATTSAVLLLAVVALGAVVACLSERAARGWVPALAAAACLPWLPVLPSPAGWAEVHMIDVGQGDAVALRSARGRWVLVDAGRSWRGGDAGRSTVVPYLRRRGGPLAAAVLTHAHADHVGGLATVVRALRPPVLYDPAFVGTSRPYRDALRAAREAGARWRRVRPGDSLVVDDLVVTFLAPDSAWAASLDDPNDASTIAMVRIGEVRVLLTGDAERAEEAWLLARGGQLRADVLKVAHHGSSTSSTDAWLDAVRPRAALVSVGALNRYDHPSADRMRALAARGARVLRTDRLGGIVLRTDGRRLELHADGDAWPIPLDSPPS